MCTPYYDDYTECRSGQLRKLRNLAMRMEQNKRWIEYKNVSALATFGAFLHGLNSFFVQGKRDYDTIYKPNPKVNVPYEPIIRMGQDFGPIQ